MVTESKADGIIGKAGASALPHACGPSAAAQERDSLRVCDSGVGAYSSPAFEPGGSVPATRGRHCESDTVGFRVAVCGRVKWGHTLAAVTRSRWCLGRYSRRAEGVPRRRSVRRYATIATLRRQTEPSPCFFSDNAGSLRYSAAAPDALRLLDEAWLDRRCLAQQQGRHP